MPKRRLNHEGSVSFDKTRNRFVARTRITDEYGESKRLYFYGKTAAEALEKMRVAQRRVKHGKPAKDSKLTVASWVNIWVSEILGNSDRKETTQENYRFVVRHVLDDQMSNKELSKVLPSDIKKLLARLAKEGKAPTTVNKLYTVLKLIFDDAIVERKITESPFTHVKRPKEHREEAEFLTREELITFLEAAKDDRLYVAMQLCAQTGLRRGEAMGLRWSDIDFDEGKFRVEKTLATTKGGPYLSTPKTEASKRRLTLNPSMSALLQSHRIAQAEEAKIAGNKFLDKDFVFSTRTGEPIDPNNFYRSVKRVCKKAGLDEHGPHVLRHTFATLLLEDGVPIHVVSRILGHSNIRITVDIYGHLSDEGQEAAMQRIQGLIGS